MRVLQVNTSYQFGGGETVSRQLLEGCLRAGHESAMLVAHGTVYPRGAGVRLMYPRALSRLSMTRFQPTGERYFPRLTWTDRAVARLVRSRWDVIHVHNFHGDYARIETLAALSRHKPVVWTFHGCWGFTGGCDHTGTCERYQAACGECPMIGRWSFLRVDNTRDQLRRKITAFRGAPFRVVSPSRWLAARIAASQVGSSWDVSVIPNGVNTQLFVAGRKRDAAFRRARGIDQDATVILLVIRDFKDDTKGFALAREAVMAANTAAVHVLLAGRGGEWAAAQLPGVRTSALGFLSSREQLADCYEVADIFLFPSPEENFPCAVLEAMSAGCCVVATPTAGAMEQIEDGRSGLLAAAFTGPALTAALSEALRSPDLRRRCGDAARGRAVNEFSESRMVARYLDLYREAATPVAACR